MKNINIFVTGGAGYIGSQVCKELFKKGYNPVVFDNLSTGKKKSVKWGPLIVGDIRNIKKLKLSLRKYQPKLVIHLAALSSVEESNKFKKKYSSVNFKGSMNLIKAMLSNNVTNLIFSSTCAIFGKPKKHLVSYSTKPKPLSYYGRTKLKFEQELKKLFKKKKISSVSLRFFNVGGADPELDIGELNFKGSRLLSRLFQSIKLKKKFIIYGKNYNTSDGTCIRDYIHVKDIAIAHVKSIKLFKKKKIFRQYNLGTGKPYSVMEVLKLTEKITRKKINYDYGPKRPGDPEGVYFRKQTSKILSLNNSSIKKIISTSWKWFKKQN